jgi:apolipoprotein N-acyltransferase
MPNTTLKNRPRLAPLSTPSSSPAPEPTRVQSHPLVAAVTSALLLWFSYPPADRGYLAWFALAPLFLLVGREDRPRRLYAGAWLGGLVFWFLAVEWVRRADESAWLAWAALATFLSLWWPVFLALARLAVRQLKLPLMLAAPIIWVGLEYTRAYILTGLPWYYLAHSQYRYLPLIQISDIAGAWGVSFLIALVNAWWVDLLSLPLREPAPTGARFSRPQILRGAVVVALFAITIGYGLFRLNTSNFRTGPQVAVIQSDLRQEYKMGGRNPREIVAMYDGLVANAAEREPRPELIIWPETSYPYGYTSIDPEMDESEFAAQAKRLDPGTTPDEWRKDRELSSQNLQGRADAAGISMLVGTSEHAFGRGGPYRYNASILFQPGMTDVQSYRKQHLVPFGEYVPFRKTFPWLIALTPYDADRVPSLDAGTSFASLDWQGLRIAAAICFEDTVPHVARRAFGNPKRQPDLLVNQSNDGWFQGSSEHEMHLAICAFRAVENRVPIARSSNRGVSGFIDGNGKILGTIPKLHADVLAMTVPLDDRSSFYSQRGDWLPIACLAVTIGLVPQAFLRRFRK